MIVHRARPWSSIKAHSWVCDKVQYYCFIPLPPTFTLLVEAWTCVMLSDVGVGGSDHVSRETLPSTGMYY